MDKLEVFGAKKLSGTINISGSKNAALPILAATILSTKKITLRNLPNVKATDINHFSALDIIKFKKVIFTETSVKELEKRYE